MALLCPAIRPCPWLGRHGVWPSLSSRPLSAMRHAPTRILPVSSCPRRHPSQKSERITRPSPSLCRSLGLSAGNCPLAQATCAKQTGALARFFFPCPTPSSPMSSFPCLCVWRERESSDKDVQSHTHTHITSAFAMHVSVFVRLGTTVSSYPSSLPPLFGLGHSNSNNTSLVSHKLGCILFQPAQHFHWPEPRRCYVIVLGTMRTYRPCPFPCDRSLDSWERTRKKAGVFFIIQRLLWFLHKPSHVVISPGLFDARRSSSAPISICLHQLCK